MSQIDERFPDGAPRSVNELLLEDWLRHAHRMERVTENEMRAIELFLRTEVLPDLMGRLVTRLERIKSRGYDTGVNTTRRFEDLRRSVLSIVDDGISEAAKRSLAGLKDVAMYEARWQAASLERTLQPIITFNAKLPDPTVLRHLVSERPVAGFNVGEWWDGLTLDTTKRIEREVRVGLAEGLDVPDIAKRIRGEAATGDGGVFDVTTRHARAIVGNAHSAVMNQAREEVYKANDVVKEVVWNAKLDTRTCPKCGALDGQRFPKGEGPMPPAHPPGPNGGRCRCARNPVTESWEEFYAKRGRKVVRKGPAVEKQRASMNGTVPRSMTYSEWLKTLEKEDLVEALGPRRAGIFERGEVSFDRMVDQSGRFIPLDRLAQIEGIEL